MTAGSARRRQRGNTKEDSVSHALEIPLLEVEVDLFIDSLAELMGPVAAMLREEQGRKKADSAINQGSPNCLQCYRYCLAEGSTQHQQVAAEETTLFHNG